MADDVNPHTQRNDGDPEDGAVPDASRGTPPSTEPPAAEEGDATMATAITHTAHPTWEHTPAHDRLVELVALIPDASLAVSDDGRILAANDLAARLYGRTPEQLERMRAEDLEGVGAFPCLDVNTPGSHSVAPCDSVHLRVDGSAMPVEISARATWMDGLGRVLIATVRDISARKALEEELQLAGVTLDRAFDAIIVHRPDGGLIDFNPAAAELFGYTMAQFSSLAPYAWTEDITQDVAAELLALLKQRSYTRYSVTGCRQDGRKLTCDISTSLIETSDGSMFVSVIRDVTDRMRYEAELKRLAFHDHLTGLANRALLDERMDLAVADAIRHRDLVGLAYIDIDEFKPVNDTYGHDVGDKVLVALAERLKNNIRTSDTVARLGGDEFVVLLPRLTAPGDLEIAAEKLSTAIAEPVEIDGLTLHVTSSIGLALFDLEGDSPGSMLAKADYAMYEAKRDGANRWRVYADEPTP